MLVSLPAGGVADTTARLFARAVSATIGQQIVVENKPGASGIIAMRGLMQAQPDGYTIMFSTSGTHTILPGLQSVPYDPFYDFEPVTMLAKSPMILAVPAASPVKSPSDLVAYSKSKPDGLNFGTLGRGSTPDLLGRLFQQASKANMTFVPYKGSSDLMVDFITGRVDFVFSSFITLRPFLDDRKVRVLAVDIEKRWEGLPDVPTTAEAGYPDAVSNTWFALVTTKNTPRTIVDKLHTEFVKAAREPEVIRQAQRDGNQVVTSTPEELRALMIREARQFEPILKAMQR